MSETVLVSMDGPTYSFLMYDSVGGKNQEGFLIGKIKQQEVVSNTDHDHQVTVVEKTIKIETSMSCPEMHHFYDATGTINEPKLREFLGPMFDRVVGWYRLRRLRLAFREKLVHRNLANLLGSKNLFVCCLMSYEVVPITKQHVFSQDFVKYTGGFESLPIHLVNLSDPPSQTPEIHSPLFQDLIKTLNINKNTPPLTIIDKVQTAIAKETMQMIYKLIQFETERFQLEQEVRELQKIKRLKNLETGYEVVVEKTNLESSDNREPRRSGRVKSSTTPQKENEEKPSPITKSYSQAARGNKD